MKHIQLALVAIVTLSAGCIVDALADVAVTQQALTTEIEPPAGWSSVRVFVGKSTNTGALYALYKQGLSTTAGACNWRQVGGPTLWNRTRVHGTSAMDEFRVVGLAESIAVCGDTLTAIPTDSKLELWAWAGNDRVLARGALSNLQVFAGNGADFVVVDSAYWVAGAVGDDWLVAVGNGDTALAGDTGDDHVCAYGQTLYLGGGDDYDWKWLGAGPPTGGTLDIFEDVTTIAFCNAAVNSVNTVMGD